MKRLNDKDGMAWQIHNESNQFTWKQMFIIYYTYLISKYIDRIIVGYF